MEEESGRSCNGSPGEAEPAASQLEDQAGLHNRTLLKTKRQKRKKGRKRKKIQVQWFIPSMPVILVGQQQIQDQPGLQSEF